MLDFSRFKVLSFDCYGTLIDWESGLLNALRDTLPTSASDDELLTLYSEIEPEVQAAGYKRYREVLREVLSRIAKQLGANVPLGQHYALAESLPNWRPFPDTVPALEKLKQRYQLAVISNIDDDLFAGTARHLRVKFDHVITAEQVGSYKPSLRNFEIALERIGQPKEAVLHVAESLFHDIAPARQLGLATVWVKRRKPGRAAASRTTEVKPDLEVPDLATLAANSA